MWVKKVWKVHDFLCCDGCGCGDHSHRVFSQGIELRQDGQAEVPKILEV